MQSLSRQVARYILPMCSLPFTRADVTRGTAAPSLRLLPRSPSAGPWRIAARNVNMRKRLHAIDGGRARRTIHISDAGFHSARRRHVAF